MRRILIALLLLGSSLSATSAHSVCLVWSPGSYGKSVTLRVWRQKNQAAYAQVVQLDNTLTSWTDTHVVAGAQYSYYLVACNLVTKDCSAASNVVVVTVPVSSSD